MVREVVEFWMSIGAWGNLRVVWLLIIIYHFFHSSLTPKFVSNVPIPKNAFCIYPFLLHLFSLLPV